MARSIHISAARTMLNSDDPVDISSAERSVLQIAKRRPYGYRLAAFVAQRRKNSDGSILDLHNVISLRYDFYGGWRNVKLLSSGECRKIRDCCIFRVNDLEAFL